MGRLFLGIIVVASALSVAAGIFAVLVKTPATEERRVLSRIDELTAAKRYEEAEEKLLEMFPESEDRSAEVCLRLGVGRSMMEDFEGAAEWFEAGLTVAPDDTKLLYNQALLFDRMEEPEKCKAALLKIVDQADYFPGINYHLGRLAEDKGDYEEADEYYVKELNMDPASHMAWKSHMLIVKKRQRGEIK